MANDTWTTLDFDQAVMINPSVTLERGRDYPFVDMQAISPGTRSVTPSEQRVFSGGGSRFVHGDTLMARITPCLENGKIARFSSIHGDCPAHGSTEFIVIRGRPGVTDSTYAYYLTIWDEVRSFAISQMTGTSGRQRVPTDSLSHLRVRIPPVLVQERIASVLGSLDDKIELNQSISETLEAMARTLFRSWFVNFDPVRAKADGTKPLGMDAETAALFPDRFEESPLGDIPRGWEVASLPEAIEVNPTRWLAKDVVAPYLEMGNMPTASARALAWEPRPCGSGAKFINGDVLLARITPCLENGKTAYVDFLQDGEVGWGSTEYIVLRSKSPLPPEYAYFLARSPELRTHAIKNMTGTSGRQRVPAECFNSFLMVVPPSEIASRFGTWSRSMMETIKVRDEESFSLAGLRDTLLPRLLSGEMRVTDHD